MHVHIQIPLYIYTQVNTYTHIYKEGNLYVNLRIPLCALQAVEELCDMTHLCVWHASSIRVSWLIHMCDMTHSYVWHDSFICATWLIHMCRRSRSTWNRTIPLTNSCINSNTRLFWVDVGLFWYHYVHCRRSSSTWHKIIPLKNSCINSKEPHIYTEELCIRP